MAITVSNPSLNSITSSWRRLGFVIIILPCSHMEFDAKMLETLVLSALACGSLSVLIILITKFFLKSESYDDMIAKRKEQENELLGGKSTKKEKGKKEKVKVKKTKPIEETGKPKAEVKPMIVEEGTTQPEVEEDAEIDVIEKGSNTETHKEATVSRRNKKKRRKNVSFSDDGESVNNVAEHELEEIKPNVVSKEETPPPAAEAHSRRQGKDDSEVKRLDDSPVIENGTSKRKKKKNRMNRNNEEEIIEPKQIQLQAQSAPPESTHQSPQTQKISHIRQASPQTPRQMDSSTEKAAPSLATEQAASKKKKKNEKRTETVTPVNSARPQTTRDPNAIGEDAQNIMKVLELTPLSRMELKTMFKVLTDRGGPALTDPDEALQTQMRILRTSEAAMREELMKERTNAANLNKSATERIQALNMKIVELQTELGRANQSLQECRQFRDENERLKVSLKNQKELEDRFKIVTDQFAINASQLDSTERAKKTLESVVERLQAQVKSYEKRANLENSLTEQLATAQNTRAAAEVDARDARRELETTQNALRYEQKSMQERAIKAEREVATLKLALQNTKAELRGAAEGQEDPTHQQQQRNAKGGAAVAAANARAEQLEKALKEKESSVKDLETQVQHLTQQIDSQRQKNNNLESRVAALQSDSSKYEQLKQQLNDRAADVANLRKENEELKKENELLKGSNGCGDLDDKLQHEIDALRTKNNELREKNWKTVEALNAAQTEAERRVKEAIEAGRAEKRELQQRIRQLESEATANQGWRGMLQKTEQEKQQAEEQVARYKDALSETEAILRDLEKSVESEEKKWQAALHSSEQECERARRELASVYGELKKTGSSQEAQNAS